MADLDRFITAQGGAWERAQAELRAGRKTSHWMWFVFPQLDGLGSSETSRRYAISSLEEAQEYLAHPTLGARLREGAQLVVDSQADSAVELMGGIDALKLRSSMTLFAAADPDEPLFQQVLDKYYDGQADPRTTDLLGGTA